jgi:uncharacterized membrane protein
MNPELQAGGDKKQNCSVDQLTSNNINIDTLKTLIKKERREHIDFRDIVQIIIGSFAAAIVFAPTSELINISQHLPIYKLVIIFLFTLILVILLAYWAGSRQLRFKEIHTIAYVIPVRVALIFIISSICCVVALWIYDIITIATPPVVILRNMVVLLLPSTWGGTLIDLAYSKHK